MLKASVSYDRVHVIHKPWFSTHAKCGCSITDQPELMPLFIQGKYLNSFHAFTIWIKSISTQSSSLVKMSKATINYPWISIQVRGLWALDVTSIFKSCPWIANYNLNNLRGYILFLRWVRGYILFLPWRICLVVSVALCMVKNTTVGQTRPF